MRDFERFIRLLAVRSGNLLNKSDLARDAGISVKKAGVLKPVFFIVYAGHIFHTHDQMVSELLILVR